MDGISGVVYDNYRLLELADIFEWKKRTVDRR